MLIIPDREFKMEFVSIDRRGDHSFKQKKCIFSSIKLWQGQISFQLTVITCIVELPDENNKVEVTISFILYLL